MLQLGLQRGVGLLRSGEISAGHARALLAHPEPDLGLRDVVGRQLSVRQTEALASRQPREDAGVQDRIQGPDAIALERRLAEQLGLKVKVVFDGRGGFIQLHFSNLEQMDLLTTLLMPNLP